MSVKRKFLIGGAVLLVLPLVLILLLWIILWAMLSLLQPTVQVSLPGGIDSSNPLVSRFLLLWAGVAILAVLGVGAAVVLWLYRSVVRPLRELNTAMEYLQNGDLTYEFVGSGDREIQELCEAYEELRRRLQTTVSEGLEQERESKMMLANISHDIKTPVTSIRGYVEGILDGVANTPEKQTRYLKTIYAKANTIELMAENLSLYSKLEMKRMLYHFAVADVFDALRTAAEEAELDLATNDMQLVCDLPEEPCMVKLDRDAMRRVFSNLITNAIKYKKEGAGVLTIGGTVTEHGVLLTFADTGIGISKTDLERVFEGFYRGDLSRNGKIAGNGLGLSICRRIVEDHGGKIWIRSETGEGTEVMLLLPVREKEIQS